VSYGPLFLHCIKSSADVRAIILSLPCLVKVTYWRDSNQGVAASGEAF